MRRRIALVILIFTASLVLHVAAQNKPINDPLNAPRCSLVGGQETKTPVTLCTGPILATDGTAKCLYQLLPVFGKLRLEMNDGAIHEIDLQKVREMAGIGR